MLLNFQRRFVPDILAGLKTHTIRADRKDGYVPKIGETLYCYTGARTKQCQHLGDWECIKVERIQVRHSGTIIVANVPLSGRDEQDIFARSDGFADHADFMRFWREKHTFPFHGNKISWRFA